MWWQKGSATIEVIITSLVAIPLLITIPLLGKQLDAKHKTTMAARYAAWERTVWSDSGSTWKNGEKSKSDQDIALEVNDRFYGHRSAEIVDVSKVKNEGITTEPMWHDRAGRSLLANAGEHLPGTTTVDETDTPVSHGFLVSLFASEGRASGILGSLEKSIGLNTGNYATAHVELPLKEVWSDDSVLELDMDADSAILSDAWSPNTESRFHSRVAGMTINDELSVFEVGTYTFGYFFLYREGKYGRNADLVPSSSVVPPKYVK